MKHLIYTVLLGCILAGCAGQETGDVEAAKAASASVPKTAQDLPANMSEMDKKRAAGAMKQGQEMEARARAENEARAKAMSAIKKEGG